MSAMVQDDVRRTETPAGTSGRADALTGRRVLVVGAARSGLAAASWLAGRGARVTLADASDRADVSALAAHEVAVELGPHRAESFLDADLIVLSPGVSPWLPVINAARARGVPIVGELELAARHLAGRIIAVTGTKGKSTTTTLIGRMCEAAGMRTRVGGNIGVPLSAQVDESTPDTLHVVEVSSFQLETTETFRPWIAVWLNFSPDHLDRHATIDDYFRAKARVFEHQREGDLAVVNADDAAVMRAAASARSRLVPFSLHHGPEPGFGIAAGHIVHRRADGTDEPLVSLTAIRLIGPHLVADVVAATATAWLASVPAEAIARAVAGFGGLEHALELVAEIGGVRFVNDSKATNIEAAQRSIESFPRGVVAILGGRFKGGDWRALRPAVRQRASALVAIGEAAPQVHAAFGDLVPVIDASSMDAAVAAASGAAPAGGVVVLAPACASFDMFRDYAERGREFKAAVARLEGAGPATRER
jgi:UDP-N-acetylmuramoylalanine--D-glutamate ligase